MLIFVKCFNDEVIVLLEIVCIVNVRLKEPTLIILTK